MLSHDVRKRFIEYFKKQSHTFVPSTSVIPQNDPTLLFNNAGMNQFKDVFLGENKRDYKRAVSCQKCIRVGGKHNDLENVGHTSRHLTFFEMMGNFAFNDYFKKEAIGFAWDVATHIFDLDPKRIWVSVYKDDDESYEYWQKHIDTNRIVKFGEEENYWTMGEIGPCGPCSELLYDRGEKYSSATTPYEDITGERYLEFWNLVFMDSSKSRDGKISPLPSKNIDTGCGLERLVSLKMGVNNIFLTDILFSLIQEIERLSKKKYDDEDQYTAPAFHVIADHIRTLSFAIADGAQPGNIERGYVLRKILRRASRYGKTLGFNKPFLAPIASKLTDIMGQDYPELAQSKSRIEEILTTEEEAFHRTLKRGGNLLNQVIEKSKDKISGEDAFKLKDTYGFPIEEILLLAKDSNLSVDLATFNKLEEKAKQLSKKAMKTHSQQFHKNFFDDFTKTHTCKFTGYEKEKDESIIIGIIVDNEFVDTIKENQEGIIILDKTPFYAENGGQIADSGTIHKKSSIFSVEDCQNPYGNVIIHIGKVKRGEFTKQEHVLAEINKEKRQKISNNHTATHLLHWALREILGEHIKQTGSIVDDKHLRFDFNNHKALTKEQIREIENLVNNKIRQNLYVKTHIKSFSEVQKDPSIIQFFQEKYQDNVRVIDIDFSKELCGGTHACRLGNIGLFKIEKESSIAAGIRRIEALTGEDAEKFVQQKEDLIGKISKDLKTDENKLETRVLSFIDENHDLIKQLKEIRKSQVNTTFATLLEKNKKIKDFNFLAEYVDIPSEEMPSLADKLLEKLSPAIVVLATTKNNRCQFIIKISENIVKKGIFANELIKQISPIIQGGGGGKKDSAQAGGVKVDKIFEAIETIKAFIEEKC